MIKFDLSQRTCNACVIACMDFRLHSDQTLHQYLKNQGIITYDLISVPGAGKSLIDEESRKLIINAIKISLELHKSQLIYLIHHSDCGTYGGSSEFGSRDEEFEHHASELDKAKSIIQEHIGSYIQIKKLYFNSIENPESKTMSLLDVKQVY